MKNILACSLLWFGSFIIASAQNLPSLKLQSISADWKLLGLSSSDQLLDSLSQLQQVSKEPLTAPVDLSTYHHGKYVIQLQNGDNIFFESPHGPVNTQTAITSSRFDVNASFALLNRKTNEYRKKATLSFGLFYQPFCYHQLQYARTDTITIDSLVLNYVYYDEWTPVLGVNGAYFFHTDPDKWINAYAGVGISAGVSVHPQIAETYGAMSDKIAMDSVGGASYPVNTFTVIFNQQNTFTAKPSLLIEGKIPFGVSFKIFEPLDLFLQGEVIASKQIYLQDGPSFPPKIYPSAGVGLKLKV